MRIGAHEPRSRETVLHLSPHRLGAMAVVVVLWAAPVASSGASPQPSSAPEDVLAHVGELFRSGQDRFETSDFDGAIELWSRAYEELPDGAEHHAIRAMLLANLAQAHVEAHAIDRDLEHLRRADGLYVSYLSMIDPADEQTRKTIEAERGRIAGILEQAQAQQREQDEATRPEPEPAVLEPAVLEPAGPVTSPRIDEPPPSRRRGLAAPFTRWERALVIGGGVTLTFAVALTGAMATFLWLRDEEEKEGRAVARDPAAGVAELRDFDQNAIRLNRLAISTSAASGVLAAIGLGLVGTADVHRRRRLSDRTTVGLGPGTLVVRGRF